MIAQVVTEKLAEIRAACEKLKVRNLQLFGSATTGEFDPARSDLDLLVEFEPEVDLFERRVAERDPNYIRRESILKSATGPIYAAA